MSTLNIGIITPTQGDPTYRNNWAQGIVNPNMTVLSAYTSEPITKSVAGSANVVLGMGTGSVGDAQHTHFIFTGALTGNINVLWPVGHTFKFTAENQTTGSFSLSIGADNGSGVPAGTVVALPVGGGVLEFYSDGTNVKAVSPSLPVIATGKMLANESGSSAIPTATDIPVLHSLVITANGTFPISANASANTIYKFTALGAGGGGGGAIQPNSLAAGGSSGAVVIGSFSGFTPSTNATITIGTAGVGGSSSGGNGGVGGTSKITYAAVDIVTAPGGGGGVGYNGGNGIRPGGTLSSGTVTVGASGLTLVSSITGAGESGSPNDNFSSGRGGGTIYGAGGQEVVGTAAGGTQSAGRTGAGHGSGGSGAASGNTTNLAGGAGTGGMVLVEWVL